MLRLGIRNSLAEPEVSTSQELLDRENYLELGPHVKIFSVRSRPRPCSECYSES